ncbi:MAG: DUF1841 family protein [Gammaproteobacteria bacterium]|nr:DUF1841 family protein [Gammaproteobacteria bacterium]MDH3468938.1 DUF1841 family protein [Gammaproteobacteria bacterium]
MYGSDRQQMRRVFFDAWKKFRNNEPLVGVEPLIVAVAQQHPEYHAVLDNSERHSQRDYYSELGDSNPFLHMGMHITLLEQIQMDTPKGIRSCFRQLQANGDDEHQAQHRMMVCLNAYISRIQIDGAAAGADDYLSCLQSLAQKF